MTDTTTYSPGCYVERPSTIADAAKALGATPADLPGLWNAPGYPELTTNQLVNEAMRKGTR